MGRPSPTMFDDGEAAVGVLRPKPLLPVLSNPRAFTVAGGGSPRKEAQGGGLTGGVGTRSFYAAAHQGVNPHDSHFHMQARLGIQRQHKAAVRLRPIGRRDSDAGAAPVMAKPPVGSFLKHRRIVVPAPPPLPGRGPPIATPHLSGAEKAVREQDRAWPPLSAEAAASLSSESRPCTVWAPGPGFQRPGSVPWQGPPGSAGFQDAELQYTAEELAAGVVERAFPMSSAGGEGQFLS